MVCILSPHITSFLPFCSSPIETLISAVLASTSWDKSLRTWDVFESKGAKEIFNLVADGLSITFRPDGKEVAVATLDGQVKGRRAREIERLRRSETGCLMSCPRDY